MFESLGIDPVSLLWQIVAFGGLVLLLNMLLFKPLRKTLDERNRRIQESMEEAERVKLQAVQADEEFKKRVEEAQRQGAVVMDQGREQARQEREKILEEAQAKAWVEPLLHQLKHGQETDGLNSLEALPTQRQAAGLSLSDSLQREIA